MCCLELPLFQVAKEELAERYAECFDLVIDLHSKMHALDIFEDTKIEELEGADKDARQKKKGKRKNSHKQSRQKKIGGGALTERIMSSSEHALKGNEEESGIDLIRNLEGQMRSSSSRAHLLTERDTGKYPDANDKRKNKKRNKRKKKNSSKALLGIDDIDVTLREKKDD